MQVFELVRLNLFSPMVLAFVLGLVVTLVKSDLKYPEDLASALTIYLLFAIGLRGGVELSDTPLAQLWAPALVTLLLGTAIPLWSYAILRRFGGFSIADAAALAAHYGSVSVVTFIASKGLLDRLQVPYEGFMPTLVALLEVPAIVVALLLASMLTGSNTNWQRSVREIVTSKSVILLLGGLVVGLLSGHEGLKLVEPFFVAPYNGILALFLLEMGMVTARRLGDLKQVGPFLVGFGLLMPVLHGALAVWLGTLAGLSLGGSTVLGAMAASASYIAAPAAVRLALPQANPSYYLTAALGITFPFNITLGIPLYYTIARWLHG